MTDSACWIEIDGAPDLLCHIQHAFPRSECASNRRISLGYRYLWIGDLRDWATKNRIPIEYPDRGYIVEQVTVDKKRLLQFLDDQFQSMSWEYVDTLRALIETYAPDDEKFRIVADEY